jgi:uncharacterized membrane protein
MIALKIALVVLMVTLGVLHFTNGKAFARTIPSFLPAPLALVYVSGGIGLLLPAAQRFAAWGLVALYVAVFPANVNMAVKHIGFGRHTPQWILWARLPLQPVFIAWAWLFT